MDTATAEEYRLLCAKAEMSEQRCRYRLVALGIVAAAAVLLSLIWGIAWYNTTTTHHALTLGYEACTVPGHAGMQWCKPTKE